MGYNYYGPQTYPQGWTSASAHEHPVASHHYGTHTTYGPLDPGMPVFNMNTNVPHAGTPVLQVPPRPVSSVQTDNAFPNDVDSDDGTSDKSDMELDNVERDDGDDKDDNDKSSVSRIKVYKECHKLLVDEKFGDHFHIEAQNLPYYINPKGEGSKKFFKTPSNTPLLKIEPDIKGSWFDPQDKENPSDSTSYWKASTPFPRKSRITPKDYPLKAPPKNPYVHIENESLRLLLEAPIFKTISLDHSAFDVSSVDVTNNPHTNLDALIRCSMLDNFTVDEYLKILLELVPKLSLTSISQGDRMQLLDLAMEVIIMIAECNQRSGQTQLATYVSNKLALRDVVLNRFSSQNTSRDILRGSTFLSHNLFGTLPESFSESLKSSTSKELRFTRKPFSARPPNSVKSFNNSSLRSFKSTKRPANFLPTPYNKRFKGKWSGNRIPFSNKFFRGKNQRKR